MIILIETLEPEEGHRIVEIDSVELVNHKETGRNFHSYLDPEREVPEEAFQIHGLYLDQLGGEPRFEEIAGELLEFLGDSPLVIHNAAFDLGFSSMELGRIGQPAVDVERNVVDTVELARSTLSNRSTYILDALARFYRTSEKPRDRHGALEDAQLLAKVYLGLLGVGEQMGSGLARGVKIGDRSASLGSEGEGRVAVRQRELPPRLTEEELEEHRKFVLGLGSGESKTLWDY